LICSLRVPFRAVAWCAVNRSRPFLAVCYSDKDSTEALLEFGIPPRLCGYCHARTGVDSSGRFPGSARTCRKRQIVGLHSVWIGFSSIFRGLVCKHVLQLAHPRENWSPVTIFPLARLLKWRRPQSAEVKADIAASVPNNIR
jgi:hypothetical protein